MKQILFAAALMLAAAGAQAQNSGREQTPSKPATSVHRETEDTKTKKTGAADKHREQKAQGEINAKGPGVRPPPHYIVQDPKSLNNDDR
jgi:hypothetical protein